MSSTRTCHAGCRISRSGRKPMLAVYCCGCPLLQVQSAPLQSATVPLVMHTSCGSWAKQPAQQIHPLLYTYCHWFCLVTSEDVILTAVQPNPQPSPVSVLGFFSGSGTGGGQLEAARTSGLGPGSDPRCTSLMNLARMPGSRPSGPTSTLLWCTTPTAVTPAEAGEGHPAPWHPMANTRSETSTRSGVGAAGVDALCGCMYTLGLSSAAAVSSRRTGSHCSCM